MFPLTAKQRKALKDFETLYLHAAEVSGQLQDNVETEVATLLSLGTATEHESLDESIYFKASGAEQGIERLVLEVRRAMFDAGYPTFRLPGGMHLVFNEDSIKGVFGYSAHNAGKNAGLWGSFAIGHKSLTVLKQVVVKHRRESGIKAIQLIRPSPYNSGVETQETVISTAYQYSAEPCFYPFIEYSAEALWSQFKVSASNVLVIIGPPGNR